ncbi:uncharacterized protein LOC143597484 [Bidens hawaiensis]|uniref:uncharacterized protein LOC143597484 n=1 Tax=Bidens hawaiensis TaxID=980011 RepID=UPI00404AD59C
MTLDCTTPQGMHEKQIEETIELEAVLQLCVMAGQIFVLYLYDSRKREGLNNTVYFHPRYIESGLFLHDEEYVIEHIKEVISFHKDKQWFMAPHRIGRHWVLILLQHNLILKTWKGHIFDSLKGTKDPSDYEITELFEKAIKQKMTWVMVDCRQQPNGWECGYCVMMAMHDFVISNKEHMLVNKKRMVRRDEINEFVERTLKVFILLLGDREDVED